MKKNTKSLLWGLVAGGAIGSVTALLLAPKAGKELRKDISDGTTATVDKAQEIVHQAADKGAEWYGIAKDTVEQVVQEVSDWSKSFAGADEEAAATVSGLADSDAAEDAGLGSGDQIANSPAILPDGDTGKQA